MGLAGWGRLSLVSAHVYAIIGMERFRAGPMSWSHSMTLPITITITATADDRFRAETPGGPVEAELPARAGRSLEGFPRES